MKVECVLEQLTSAITATERVAGNHPTLPILNCILISVENSTLKVRSTNLELGLEVGMAARVLAEGMVAVPAATLLNTLLNTHTAQVTLETKGTNLVIKTPNGETNIATVSADDFPTLPTIGNKPLKILGRDLLRGLKAVWFAGSAATIKPELGSVCLYPEGQTLVFVATDSFRLAEKIIPLTHPLDFKTLLLPLRSVPELLRFLERADGDIAVRVSEHQISFTADDHYLTSRVIEGVFPDYRQIIPKEKLTEVVALKHDLLGTLKKALVFSGKFNQVQLSVQPKKKQFVVSSGSDVGETTDTVPSAVSGEDLSVHFNLKYLLDCFQALGGDSVSLAFSGAGKPLVARDAADASFLYLVMPMNR